MYNCTSIAHAIISACRPRSFISPILLSIAVYIYQRYGCRELNDMLSGMSFFDDYKEVQLIPSYFDDFCQFVFDNTGFNVFTTTEHKRFHAMGGIACVAPAGDVTKMIYKRSIHLPDAQVVKKFGKIPIKPYLKPAKIGLSSVSLDSLEEINTDLPSMKVPSSLDQLWLITFALNDRSPGWSEFMQVVVKSEGHGKTRLEIVPFINLDPSK